MERRPTRWLAALTGGALVIAGAGVMPVSARQAALAAPPCGINLRLLVISADGMETGLPAIRQALEYLGTPYDLFVATARAPLSTADLTSGCTARYQGIITATGELTYEAPGGYASAFTAQEFATLAAYESLYRVRRLVWYAYPSPELGFEWPTWPGGSTGDPVSAVFTPAAAAVFTHVNRANPLRIMNANVYLSRNAAPGAATGETAEPLLIDADGHALAALYTRTDGRQILSLTFDSNPHLTHSLVLAYDLVSWVTKGIFLGERHVYMSPQIDDIFIHNQMWSPETLCGTPVDATTRTFRMAGRDLTSAVAWQRNIRTAPLTSKLRLTWAFNGEGTSGIYQPDDLTSTARAYRADFHWVSHTWDHDNLDAVKGWKAAEEVYLNAGAAARLGLNFDVRNLVTPDVSGLKNYAAMRAIFREGVRYVVTDTSRAGYSNPSPNTGLWNESQPRLFMIPRYPNNLFFNVSTPEEWVAEYNCMYRDYWKRDFTYQDVLDNISDTFVTYLLKGDLNPLMFHQPNVRAYDGRRSLLSDLIDTTIRKYNALVTFPIDSPTMDAVGDKMIARETYNNAGITAKLVPGKGLVLTAVNRAVVPITGLNVVGAEQYAGQTIAYIPIAAARTKTIAIPVAVQ
jgi:hypothetical protein